MIKKHKLIVFFLILFVSCDAQENLNCEVSGITFDHVINERGDCRFSSIYIQIEFNNTTLDEIEIDFTCFNSFCYNVINESNLMLSQIEKLTPLALHCEKSNITIPPMKKAQFKFRLMEVVKGQSLNDIIKNYQSLLEEDFTVFFSWRNKTIKIEQSNSFETKFFLDDKLVSLNDTLLLNKTPLPPEFKPLPDVEIIEEDR